MSDANDSSTTFHPIVFSLLHTLTNLKEFRERAVQLAQRKDGNPVHFVEACPTDAAVDGNAEDKGKGNCSPLHSPSNGNGHGNVSSHGADRLNEGLPDMAEEKEMDRDRDGRFVPRDNNIEDVNMNMVGAKSGDKSVDAPTAKEASPSSRSGSKMEASFANDEHAREDSQAATEGLGALTILAPRGMGMASSELHILRVSILLVPLLGIIYRVIT